MKLLKLYIIEAMNELYHFTGSRNLERILKNDTFIASPDDGHNYGPYKYYISTTRVQFAGVGYPTQMIGDICKIVLNGTKLSYKYKIKPISFDPGSKSMAVRNNHIVGEWDLYKDEWLKQSNVESEDRILLNTDHIPHISKYIKRIILNNETIDPKIADNIIRYCDKLGIDLTIVQNAKEFSLAH